MTRKQARQTKLRKQRISMKERGYAKVGDSWVKVYSPRYQAQQALKLKKSQERV